VNQNIDDFPNEYLDRLTSLFIESKKLFFLDNIVNLFFDEFKNNLDSLIKKDIKKILDELTKDFKIFEEPFYILINNKKEKVYGEKFIDDKTIYVKKKIKKVLRFLFTQYHKIKGGVMKIDEIVVDEPGKKLFLLGNEAIVRGFIEGGGKFAAAYPGTPSSEIGDTLSKIGKLAI